jgi:hypothetical protein
MITRRRRSGSIGAVFLAALLTLAGCEDPFGTRPQATGAVFIRADGTEAARFTLLDGATGQLTARVNQTTTYRVRLFDESGGLLNVDGWEYSLRDPAVVIAHAVRLSIQGSDVIAIEGVAPVQTSLQFEVYRGNRRGFEVYGIPLRIQ